MHGYYIFTILILITTLFSYINSNWVKLPVSITVTIFTLLVSSVLIFSNNLLPQLNADIKANLDRIQFDQIVIDVLLGFLLFSAAFRLDALNFKKHIGVILSLAFIGTLLSTFIVGTLVYYTFHFLHQDISYLNCLLFGAIISPTDPIAALAILKQVNIADEIELQITGESLLNDGLAIVFYLTLMHLSSPHSNDSVVVETALLFLREAGGALIFGLALGALAFLLLKSVANFKVEILITISVVMGGYTLARLIEVSPPLSMVVAGLVCSVGGKGRHHTHISHEFVMTFWEIVEDFINVVLFLLIGVGVFVIPLGKMVLFTGAVTIFTLLISRYLSLLPIYALLRSRFAQKSLLLFTWAGLRGAVSIALALSLPARLHGSEFLAITYIIAVFSIVVQGLTIKPLARHLGLGAK